VLAPARLPTDRPAAEETTSEVKWACAKWEAWGVAGVAKWAGKMGRARIFNLGPEPLVCCLEKAMELASAAEWPTVDADELQLARVVRMRRRRDVAAQPKRALFV